MLQTGTYRPLKILGGCGPGLGLAEFCRRQAARRARHLPSHPMERERSSPPGDGEVWQCMTAFARKDESKSRQLIDQEVSSIVVPQFKKRSTKKADICVRRTSLLGSSMPLDSPPTRFSLNSARTSVRREKPGVSGQSTPPMISRSATNVVLGREPLPR